MNVDELIALSGKLFNRGSLLDYWQEVAYQFYPERADFTTTRFLGEEMLQHLSTSYPVLARRELGDTFSAMLRPKEKDWFQLRASREEVEGTEEREWLEWATATTRRAMYDRLSGFTRATKQGDHDFGTFGQCVISVELNRARDGFLYRNWHLRDCAWRENAEMQIDTVFRKWKPTATDLEAIFGDRVHGSVAAMIRQNEPYKEIECLHCVVPSQGRHRQPFRSVYIDATNRHIMEDRGAWTIGYVVPRWQTVSGSQYAHSPAVIAALPDARLIQAVTLTLLDAGEMYAAPPMLAVREAIRGDIDLRSRGITWVDAEYDERLGDVLRPVSQDSRGYPIGDNIREEARTAIADAFFLSKLQLPPADTGQMTAYEVAQRVQEFIRTTLPLFEPVEDDYNGALCDLTFEIGMRNGMYGPPTLIPERLRGADIEFRFISPLSQARDREKGNQFLETAQMLAQAVQLDPNAAIMLDTAEAIRDALHGIGTPASWMRDEREVEEMRQAAQEAEQTAATVQGVGQMAQVGQQVGAAAQALEGVV
jgi:hypothetical protein